MIMMVMFLRIKECIINLEKALWQNQRIWD
jgi:hypothetical protein